MLNPDVHNLIYSVESPLSRETDADRVKMASLDIFDTTLTRLVGKPDSAFILLGKRLCKGGLLAVSAEVFARNRATAEVLAREQAPNAEPTLVDIYASLRWILGFAPDIVERIMEEELALEADLLRAMPGTPDLIRELKKTADSVVFLSDMYLPSQFLEEQLSRLLGLPKPIDVVVSCEWKASKASGDLFCHLLRNKGVSPKQVLHIGNNPSSDHASPARIGIRTKLVRTAELNRYETILEDHRWETGGLTSILAGASRMARLSVPATDPREQVTRDLAAGVTAPALVGYVLWVLKRARDLKIERLYFVSRDGELLLQIASALAKKLQVEMELRYLYGSRQAWHLPAFGLADRREEEWLFADAHEGLSVAMVLEKVGLTANDIGDVLLKHGLARNNWRNDLDQAGLTALKDAISDPVALRRIAERAADARQLMIGYLRQEGMLDGLRAGIVDLGWTGRMFDSLWAVLKSEQGQMPSAFLFGSSGSGDSDWLPKERYLFDHLSGQGYLTPPPGRGLTALLEAFCAGSHGMVRGYQRAGERITPVFKEPVNRSGLEWNIATLRRTVLAFVEHMWVDDPEAWLAANIRPAVHNVLCALCDAPTQLEARLWSGYHHFGTQTESYGFPLAMAFSIRHVFDRLMGRPVRHKGVDWQAGSLRLTPAIIRHGMRLAGRLRRVARTIHFPSKQFPVQFRARRAP